MVLRYELSPAESTSPQGVLLLLHGRGSDRFDLFALRNRFPADWAVMCPEAPFPAAPWGYGPGWAWYQFLGRNRPEPDSFSQSVTALAALIAALPDIVGHAPRRLALGGFSQGGTLSLAFSVMRTGKINDVINFSGFLADHPDVIVDPETVRGTRYFWGHGVADQNIPFDLAIEGREVLRRAGANLEARDYRISHSIDARELEDAVAWLQGA